MANITLFESTETVFTHNGLAVLGDCKTAFIEEMLNDKYELEIEYPIDARGKWQYLVEGNIIKADAQLFRIYHKEIALTGIKVNARHIFYDLLNNFVENASIENLNAAGALNAILAHTQYAHGFTAASDVTGALTYAIATQNPIEAIMGDDGVIARYGGELERNNYVIDLHQARGLDRDVLIVYGKNIVGIEETLDMASVCTRIYPVGKDSLLLTAKYLDSNLITNYPHPIIKKVEFNDCETESDLEDAAQAYLDKNDTPLANYKVDFIELTKTVEYKSYAALEMVSMGDTVTIRHTKLNINIKLEVIRIKKNVLTNRIEEVELGRFKPNIATNLTRQQRQIDTTTAVTTDVQNGDLRADIIKIGTPNGRGTCQVDTRGDGLRLQPHPAGTYTKFEDDGGLSFYVDDTCYAQIFPDGTTSLTSKGGGGGEAGIVKMLAPVVTPTLSCFYSNTTTTKSLTAL